MDFDSGTQTFVPETGAFVSSFVNQETGDTVTAQAAGYNSGQFSLAASDAAMPALTTVPHTFTANGSPNAGWLVGVTVTGYDTDGNFVDYDLPSEVVQALPATPVLGGSYNTSTGDFDLSLPADPAIAGYTFQRQTSSGLIGWTTIDTAAVSGTGPITYSDPAISASGTYRVTVTNFYGQSVTSNPLTLPAAAPDAPTGLTVSEPTGSPHESDVSWSHDLTVDTGYVVIATPAVAGVAVQTFDVPAGTLTCDVTGLTTDMPYTLSVSAVNTFVDGTSVSSAAATIDATPGAPAGPAIPLTSVTAVSSTQVEVAWNVSGSAVYDGFEIAAADESLVGEDTGPEVPFPAYKVVAAAYGTDTSVLVSGLNQSSDYSFVIFGYDPTGSTYGGEIGTATTVTPLTLTVGDPFAPPGQTPVSTVTASSALTGAVYTLAVSYNASGPAVTESGTSGTFSNVAAGFLSVSVNAAVVNSPSGAFDSVTYYNYAPTIVVTGTAGDDSYNVSVDDNGLYTVTGSVTPIPAFYAPDGINLDVYGRGGTDTLTVGGGKGVTTALSQGPFCTEHVR
jgi:hypothetical protein